MDRQKELQPTDAVKMIADMVEEENSISSSNDVDKMADMIAKMTEDDAKALKEKLFPSNNITTKQEDDVEEEDGDGDGEEEDKEGEE